MPTPHHPSAAVRKALVKLGGDLRDEKAVGSVLVRKLQSELTAARLEKLGIKVEEI